MGISSLFGQTIIFQQNFNASNTVSDYIGSPPSTNQFNHIGASTGVGINCTVVNGKLKLSKPSTTSVGFTRNTNFASTPTVMAFIFTISVSDNSVADVNSGKLYIGQNLSTNFSFPENADTYARLYFNISATTNSFQLRDIRNDNTSTTFTGETLIHWVLNNSGSSITYLAPDNSLATLANDKADVWANRSIIFNDVNVQSPTVNMEDMKFLLNDGNASFTFDNMVIQEGNINLPVELTKLATKPTPNSIFVNWQTASETNNDYFAVEHSLDAKTYNPLGQIKGHGTKLTTSQYTYEHTTPSVGSNYYRLKQVDFDGTFTYSPIISVDFDGKKKGITLLSNITDAFLQVDSDRDIAVDYTLVDMMGRVVKRGQISGNSTLDISALQANFYALRFETGEIFKVLKY